MGPSLTLKGPASTIRVGPGHPLLVIAGPCALESRGMALEVGRQMRGACAERGLSYIFKASFDKANRTSSGAARGPGIGAGLDDLAAIRDELQVPITTDVHLPEQCARVAEVVDVLQVPAFLCRQTDLLVACAEAAARHGRVVNVKKGQFLSPREMAGPVAKLLDNGSPGVMVTERGTFFGYHRLVTDFIGVGDLIASAQKEDRYVPVCFDATHSTQLPGESAQSGGRAECAPLLARAAIAAGVDALFIEVHPDPPRALSDAASQVTPEQAVRVLDEAVAIRSALAALGQGVGAGPARSGV